MAYKVVYDSKEYYAEVHIFRGFAGTQHEPPEPPGIVIDEVEDENGNPVSEELFDQMEEEIMKQLEEMIFGY